MSRKKIEYWVMPPQADSEFVANMEEVLETYALPLDPQHPVICMDEQPSQLLKETRVPIPATKAHPRRLEFRHTPKHGSWLNIVENELSSMTRQCVRNRGFGTIEALRTVLVQGALRH